MKIAGEYLFAAPQNIVWEALLDPTVLASVLPGCDRLDLIGENEYEGQLQIKVGPVNGSFLGKVKLTNIVAPTSYSMAIDGRGAPGFVKASANISLASVTVAGGPDSTRLTYDSDAQVGGRIASVGQRLIESSARAIIKQSLEGLNAATLARADAARAASAATAAGASAAEAQAAAARVAAPSAIAPPSQLDFATSVAKEVAKDLVPPGARRTLLIVAILLVAVLLLRFIF
jgi:carbon monoxide dehydrogenase subunit G